MGLLAAMGRLRRKRARVGGRSDDGPSAAERRAGSEGFFEERAKALGPEAYGHVDVDRQFRRP